MILAAGTRLGPYEILHAIGAGGMGEVYKARDTRLDRTVAIKILPPDHSDPEHRARFEREARTIASLSHPHICTLYDVGEHATSLYLVMEHLPGETLAERLRKGALPVEQALAVSAQIADALSAAHRAGIVHRDLKPANVMLSRSGVKLLDFGLARLHAPVGAPVAAMSATHTEPLTGRGEILGTLPYMAPEQIEGKHVDARTDIWALGLVLYEMLTGQRAFEGSSSASLIGAILERQPPPPSAVEALTPSSLDRIVSRCLAKDPEERWQDARDLAAELRWQATATQESTRHAVGSSRGWQIVSTVLGVLLVAAAVVVGWFWRAPRSERSTAASMLLVATGAPDREVGGGVTVSPDGKLLAFVAGDSSGSRVYLRPFDGWEVRPLAGTDDATGSILFTPDGQSLLYSAADRRPRIYRVPLSAGRAELVVRGSSNGMRMTPGGDLLFSRGQPQKLFRLPAGGGEPQVIVDESVTGMSGRYAWPDMMPDGLGIVFTHWLVGRSDIYAFSLRDRKTTLLIKDAIRPRYFAQTGHLLYQANGQLRAMQFDPVALRVSGTPVVIADGVGTGHPGMGEYDVSPSGVLAYVPPLLSSLAWRDRSGAATELPFKPRQYTYVQLAPDGRHAVLGVLEGVAHRLFLADLDAGEPLTPLTRGDDDFFGLFSADGRRVFYTIGNGVSYNVASVLADGSGRSERLTTTAAWQRPTSISPSGSVLLLNHSESGDMDVAELQLGRPNAQLTRVVSGPEPDLEAVFSPDGQWIAYEQGTVSDERQEIYVQRYPNGARTQISSDGGEHPVWSRTGGELFYHSNAGLMIVPVANGMRTAPAKLLIPQSISRPGQWAVSPDGTRFLIVERAHAAQIHVVLNWADKLKGKRE